MERLSLTELVSRVRVILDENRVETAYLTSDTDNMELDEIIRSCLVPAARAVAQAAPLWMAEPQKATVAAGQIQSNTDGSGRITLPPDFLRLAELRLSGWKTSVYEVFSPLSPRAMVQRSSHTRGTPLKPVAVLSMADNGIPALDVYSIPDGTTFQVERLLYISVPAIEQNDDTDYLSLPSLLVTPVSYYCAGLTLQSVQRLDLAQQFFVIAQSYYTEQSS